MSSTSTCRYNDIEMYHVSITSRYIMYASVCLQQGGQMRQGLPKMIAGTADFTELFAWKKKCMYPVWSTPRFITSRYITSKQVNGSCANRINMHHTHINMYNTHINLHHTHIKLYHTHVSRLHHSNVLILAGELYIDIQIIFCTSNTGK